MIEWAIVPTELQVKISVLGRSVLMVFIVCAGSGCRDRHTAADQDAPARAAANRPVAAGEAPMAPFGGPSKKQVMQQLRQHRAGPVEITVGRMQPQFVIQCADTAGALRPLVLHVEKADEAGERALAEGRSWMAEMTWCYLSPGAPIIQDRTIESFIAKLEAWRGWADLPK
jgi:hypothetical protein